MGIISFEPVPRAPTPGEIKDAREVIRGAIHVTPMLHSHTFSAMTGANVYLKTENFYSAQGPSRCVGPPISSRGSVRRNAGTG